jgi:hypothetical protein
VQWGLGFGEVLVLVLSLGLAWGGGSDGEEGGWVGW